MTEAILTGVKITPLGGRILVRPSQKRESKKGGLVIPETAKDKPQEGEVMAVGRGKVMDNGKVAPMDVKEGDRVLYRKYAGTELKIDGSDYLILEQDDVLGIVTPGPDDLDYYIEMEGD